MALLWVKLGGKNIVLYQCGGKIDTVMAASGGLGWSHRTRVITVHEIEARILFDSVPQRMVAGLFDLVPAHVGHLEALAVFEQVITEELHLAGKQAEAVNAAIFFTAFQQHLHADTDTQQGLFGYYLTHDLIQSQLAQFTDAVADGADPGQYHAFGVQNLLRVTGD